MPEGQRPPGDWDDATLRTLTNLQQEATRLSSSSGSNEPQQRRRVRLGGVRGERRGRFQGGDLSRLLTAEEDG